MRLSLARLLMAIAMVTLAANVAVTADARAVSRSKPKITGLVAYPNTVASGGTTGISAAVTGADTCTLSAPKSKPVNGLMKTFPCGEAGTMRVVAMPTNRGQKAVSYTLTLTAVASGGKGKAKAKVTIAVLPETVAAANKGLISGSCAVVSQGAEQGTVRCWGGNGHGDLGGGGSSVSGYSTKPLTVLSITNAVEVASADEHVCALLATGHLKCWGKAIGLGNGAEGPEFGEPTPVAVVDIANAVQVTAGYEDACALLDDGHVDCWGANYEGRLGPGGVDEEDHYTPIAIPGVANAVEVTADREVTCARLEGVGVQAGRVECWGSDNHGAFGDGTNGLAHATPFAVADVGGAIQIASGEDHLCAISSQEGHPTAQTKCWGWDAFGQLGDDNLGYIRKPEDVVEAQRLPVSGAEQVSAGTEHTCALLRGGTVECWGSDARGQLGDGRPGEEEMKTVAVPVAGHLEQVVEIAASTGNTCALLEDGGIKCWGGDREGELGDGMPVRPFSAEPVAVQGFPPPSSAARRGRTRRKAHSRHTPHTTKP
jgi:alpha-tubulin suppressor-like RCC1 family protein